jgi:hypothetical protein
VDPTKTKSVWLNAYRLLAHGWWFSPGIPASSTTKNGRHDIAEILLKVALSTINKFNQTDFVFVGSTRSYCFQNRNKNNHQLITVLERDSLTLIDWFTENQMKANPDKFQAIAIEKKNKNENISFNLNGNIIKWNFLV